MSTLNDVGPATLVFHLESPQQRSPIVLSSLQFSPLLKSHQDVNQHKHCLCRGAHMRKHLGQDLKKKEMKTLEVCGIRTRLINFLASRKVERIINTTENSHFQNWMSHSIRGGKVRSRFNNPQERAVTYLLRAS